MASGAHRMAASRLLTPAGLSLALICFLFGFLAVSCETPGGYGRTPHGGTTTYTGLDLAVGTAPTVDKTLPSDVVPAVPPRPDNLGWQPAIALAALAILVAAVAGAGTARRRRPLVVGGTATGVGLLVIGELLAHRQLTDRVAEQVRRPLPPDRAPADYVQVGGGFSVALIILGTVLAGYLVGHLRRRGRTGAAGRTS